MPRVRRIRYTGLLVSLLFVICATPITALSAELPAAGIPNSPLWFSKDPFYVGESVTISALIYNSSPYRFTGSVTLRDGSVTIGAEKFALDPNGASRVVTFPWTATAGTHAFTLTITDGAFLVSGKDHIDLPISTKSGGEVRREVVEKPVPKSEPETLAERSAEAKESDALATTTEQEGSFVSRTIRPVIDRAESFREEQATMATNALDAVKAELPPADTPSEPDGDWKRLARAVSDGDVLYTPWSYTKYFFALIWHFLTSNAYVFYILIFLVVYKIIAVIRGLLN